MPNAAFGLNMQFVPYRGDSQQLVDFLAGRLDVAVVGGASSIGPHGAGQGRILALTGEQRMPGLPDVPVIGEFAPGFVAQTWFGLMVPARTPRAAVDRLNAAVVEALGDAELRQQLEAGRGNSSPALPPPRRSPSSCAGTPSAGARWSGRSSGRRSSAAVRLDLSGLAPTRAGTPIPAGTPQLGGGIMRG